MRNRSPALQSNHRPDKEEAAMPLSKAQGGEVNNKKTSSNCFSLLLSSFLSEEKAAAMVVKNKQSLDFLLTDITILMKGVVLGSKAHL